MVILTYDKQTWRLIKDISSEILTLLIILNNATMISQETEIIATTSDKLFNLENIMYVVQSNLVN